MQVQQLDRFLVSKSFEDRWNNMGERVLERKWSDHFRIMLCENKIDYGPTPFKFYDAWLSDMVVGDIVKKSGK